MKIAYLGPEGTFTQQAACLAADDYISQGIVNGGELSFIPLSTIEETFSSVANGKTDFDVVPIVNDVQKMLLFVSKNLIKILPDICNEYALTYSKTFTVPKQTPFTISLKVGAPLIIS